MRGDVFGVAAPHPPIMVQAVGGARAAVTSASISSLRHAAKLLAEFEPETVVIMSPHSPAAADAFVIETASSTRGSLEAFGAPDVALSFRGAPELADRLQKRLHERRIPTIDRAAVPALNSGVLDHGVLVPMSFLDPNADFALLDVSLSFLPYDSHLVFGEALSAAAADLDRRIAFVASGDCSHRLTRDAPAGYSPGAAAFDSHLVDVFSAGDLSRLSEIDPETAEDAGECGLRSFIALSGFAPNAPTELLSYEGPWGVGYLTAIVGYGAVPSTGGKGGTPGGPEHPLVLLARDAITLYTTQNRILDAPSLHLTDVPTRAGVFVSLHRDDALRGCIGTISPTRATLAEEVVRNAIEAAANDPRFESLTEGELEDLEIKVDVLHEPEPAQMDDLDPKHYGVIVSKGWRRGLLLPDLEGVDSAEMQVAIARRKADIRDEDPIELQRFRVDRYA